jgi:hypothetical protein
MAYVLNAIGDPEMTGVAYAHRLGLERAAEGMTSLVDGGSSVQVHVRPVEVNRVSGVCGASGLRDRPQCSCVWGLETVCPQHGDGVEHRCLQVCQNGLRASACSPATPCRRNEGVHMESCHLSVPLESVVV